RGATDAIRRMPREMAALPLRSAIAPPESDDRLDVADLTASLRSLMVRKMGIVRERSRLLEAKEDLRFWCRYVLSRELDAKPGWGPQNLLPLAPPLDARGAAAGRGPRHALPQRLPGPRRPPRGPAARDERAVRGAVVSPRPAAAGGSTAARGRRTAGVSRPG